MIRPVDLIETGSNSELVFVVGKDAFMLREHGELELSPLLPRGGGGGAGDEGFAATILGGLRLLTGRILTVFGERGPARETVHEYADCQHRHPRHRHLRRVQKRPRLRLYLLRLDRAGVGRAMPTAARRSPTSHHDSPRYIADAGPAGERIRPAPVINHTDMELVLIEQLVGRKPPFWPLETGY
ncbi:MAG: hypothetical protein U5K33_10160 [Halofilum sp. (in: g-proteobacteria)]|nr:hypothetical protein [Halofilum sp. (in: g-proteobacteria)]